MKHLKPSTTPALPLMFGFLISLGACSQPQPERTLTDTVKIDQYLSSRNIRGDWRFYDERELREGDRESSGSDCIDHLRSGLTPGHFGTGELQIYGTVIRLLRTAKGTDGTGLGHTFTLRIKQIDVDTGAIHVETSGDFQERDHYEAIKKFNLGYGSEPAYFQKDSRGAYADYLSRNEQAADYALGRHKVELFEVPFNEPFTVSFRYQDVLKGTNDMRDRKEADLLVSEVEQRLRSKFVFFAQNGAFFDSSYDDRLVINTMTTDDPDYPKNRKKSGCRVLIKN